MNFESELKKGNFMITDCNYCEKIVWPSKNFCNQCFRETKWRKSSGIGKILEFSKKNGKYFCLVEIENAIKFIGQMDSEIPEIGNKVKITDCDLRDNNLHVKLKILN